MDEIGSILRDAREMKGLTIAEVHEKLRISKKYIAALEEGRYDVLPSQTHVRGYLNKYSRFLGLQAEPLLERYEAAKKQRPLPTPTPSLPTESPLIENPLTLPEPETGTFFAYNNLDLSNAPVQQGETDWIGRLIVVALLVAIALIGWRFSPLLLGEDNTLTAEDISTAVTNILSREENSETTASDSEPSLLIDTTPAFNSTDLITSTSRTAGSSQNVNEQPVATPTRSPLPATMESIAIQIDVLERDWILVEVDGEVVFEGAAQQGEVLSWEAANSVHFRTGNAAATFITINGIELGRLGERGQVADETWVTTQ